MVTPDGIRKGVDWSLKDEIQAAERRLQTMCDQVNAGTRQGGGREFRRQIDAQFAAIREHPEYNQLRNSL